MHALITPFLTNRHLLAVSIVAILVAGVSALNGLPRQEDPTITNRNPLILTFFPGATAERVEALVTEPIERELKEIAAIKRIRSTSRAGVSVVRVELADRVTKQTNQPIFSEIRDKLADAAAQFPPGVLPPDFDDKRNAVAYTLIAGLSWRDGVEASPGVLARHAEELAERFRAVPGTDLVRVYGEPEEEILVTVEQGELAALGLSIQHVARILRNADTKLPAGQLRGRDTDLLIQVEGELDSAARLRQVPLIQRRDGVTLRLGDVAGVERTVREPAAELALLDGRRGVLVAARVQSDERIDVWTQRARAALERYTGEVGEGIRVETVFNQDDYTSERLGQLSQNLVLGAVIVLLVVFVTMGWRSALIVGSALPLTAALTLFVVAALGGQLHQMSIFGMIIALGLLIDNAIVISDEVRRRLEQGESPGRALEQSVRHLFAPLLSSTATTILAFLPILLLPGNSGDFVSSIGGSVVVALICSFVVAFAIIGALSALFLNPRAGGPAGGGRWFRGGLGGERVGAWTGAVVGAAVRRPFAGMASAMSLPVLGFVLAQTLGSQFFPRTDRNMFEIDLWMPTETSLARTREVAERIEAMARRYDGVRHVRWLVGGSFPPVYYNLVMNQDGSPHYAHGIVEAETADQVRDMVDALQAEIDGSLPEAQVVVSKFAQGPPIEADVEFRVLGPDVETLHDLGDRIRVLLAQHPDIVQSRVSMPRGEARLWIDADETEARMAGLQLGDLAAQLQARLDGVTAGLVLEDIESLPIRVRYRDERRDDVADVAAMNFVSTAGPNRWVPLTSVATVGLRPELGGITQRDGARVNQVLGYARTGSLPIQIARDVQAGLEREGFATLAGYRVELGGESENQAEALGNLVLYLPVLVVLTVSILVLSFRSVGIAVILLAVAPLSAGFGLLATWFGQFPLSFNTVIGSLGLMGLAFNSSIVVLASIRTDAAARLGDPDAIARRVLVTGRHLVSTTLTTMGSFLPLLLLIGGEFWPPLAIVLAGGVAGSTLLAVTFTPAAYRLLAQRGGVGCQGGQ